SEQITQLDSQIAQLRERVAQRDEELARQDEAISERDRLIAIREARSQALEQELSERESQLAERDKELEEREKQLAFLRQEVEVLEQYYQNYQTLRQGNVAVLRGQVLAFGVVRIVDPKAANQALDQLLREANRAAIEITQPGNGPSKEPLVQLSQTQAEQLINQIKDGQDYVVRILSAGNYVVGEKPIQVFADAAPNEVILQPGEVLSVVSVDSSSMTNREVQQRLDQLLAVAQFRARRAGILGQIQVGDGRFSSVVRFIEQLSEYDQPLDIRAVTQETAYTAGPLKMRLVATRNGEIIFST
ncbi:MAG: DUF3084 domain-containing protein, partial [Coleofasciculus sp. S288]|nr:DUF3084 domain-containing protein [Coleofasciculus sp. S288]